VADRAGRAKSEAPGARTSVPVDAELLAATVDAIFEQEALPALSEFTAIPTLSPAFDAEWPAHGHLRAGAEMLRGWCRAHARPGSVIEIVELDGLTPTLFADIPGPDAGAPTTVIYGHLDKQPPLGEWRAGLDPFRAVRDGDRLYGRGTADDGYAVFSAFTALKALARLGRGHGRVVVLIEGSEESGSPDLDAYLDALAERIGAPELVICLDSGCLTYDRLWVTTSLRGMLRGTLTVEVLEEGVHSGLAGGIVPSSFRILRRLLERIEDSRTGDLLLPELRVDVPPHRRREITELVQAYGPAAAGTFPAVPGLVLDGADNVDRVIRGTWAGSLALTGADGIPPLALAGNVLRSSTSVQLSVRLPPTAGAETARDALDRVLTSNPPSGALVRTEWEVPSDGWDAPPYVDSLRTALEESSLRYFGNPLRHMGIGGSIPFMASLTRRYPQAQLLVTGVNGPQSNAHGLNEFLHVPTAKAVTATVAHILAASA
jgi:acetylornithine deacetylase/succinyl-diaminopimelate desuccinylase-like protein